MSVTIKLIVTRNNQQILVDGYNLEGNHEASDLADMWHEYVGCEEVRFAPKFEELLGFSSLSDYGDHTGDKELSITDIQSAIARTLRVVEEPEQGWRYRRLVGILFMMLTLLVDGEDVTFSWS